MEDAKEVAELYQRFIHAWNNRDASAMVELFSDDGEMIGFDESIVAGREEILSHLKPIFEDHPTPPFVYKIKNERVLTFRTRSLRAIAGMVPPGKTELDPSLNTHQMLVAVYNENGWYIEIFQNTPAQFDGRPELVEQMTVELREVSK